MALAPVGVSRISLFKASSFEFNGSNWVSGGCFLATTPDATRLVVLKSAVLRRPTACSAVQESSTPTVSAETKEAKTKNEEKNDEETNEAELEAKPARPKPKPAAKAAAKALPQMMDEDVIPALRQILEAQQNITDIELTFQDNKLEGSFLQKDIPYTFWAFFPDGLTGPKGFSLSSYGSEASTVEPFLVDEKKITAKHVIFWVEKRLAAQGIIPVWKE